MTTREFSNAFQIKYNAIMSNAMPALDDYEISYFLSTAQKELVLEVYKGVFSGDSFEGAEDVRQYINHLIKEYKTSESIGGDVINNNSKLYHLPNDVWFRIIEWVDYNDSRIDCDTFVTTVTVTPVTYNEYHTIKNNPFRRQNKKRVLRLDKGSDIVEVISDYNIGSYGLRYICMPKPIIVANLSPGLSIDGISVITECDLNQLFHVSRI